MSSREVIQSIYNIILQSYKLSKWIGVFHFSLLDFDLQVLLVVNSIRHL